MKLSSPSNPFAVSKFRKSSIGTQIWALVSGTVFGSVDYACVRAPQRSGASMQQTQLFYQRQERLIWWFVMARISQGLREHYKFPTELPPEFLMLVRRLDELE